MNKSLRLKDLTMVPRSKLTLRRLPMWGLSAKDDQVNFSWPSQEQLNQMPSDVTLKSLEFKTCNSPYLSSIKCNLSNSFSTVFEKVGKTHSFAEVINFDASTPVKKV